MDRTVYDKTLSSLHNYRFQSADSSHTSTLVTAQFGLLISFPIGRISVIIEVPTSSRQEPKSTTSNEIRIFYSFYKLSLHLLSLFLIFRLVFINYFSDSNPLLHVVFNYFCNFFYENPNFSMLPKGSLLSSLFAFFYPLYSLFYVILEFLLSLIYVSV